MSKKSIIIALFVALGTLFIILIFFHKNKQISLPEKPIVNTASPTAYLQNNNVSPSFVPQPVGTDYKFSYLIVRPTDIIDLYSNLEEKLTSIDAMAKHGCTDLISGGFYDTDNKHIGLFVTQGKTLSAASSNNLFNGFFLIDNKKNSHITFNEPTNLNDFRIAMQAGPVVYFENKPVTQTGLSDPARRIIAAINNRGEIILISLSIQNNPLSGPTLKELPEIIKNINKNTSLNIVDAINLDGGAHSVFITNSVNLSEIANIGSYFCIKSN